MRYIVLSPFLSKPLEKMMISVLIADDQSLARNLLQRLLERAGDIQIVAIAFDGQEAIEQAVLHCPDVAVVDVSMPTLNGIEATSKSARAVLSFLDMGQCALVI